RSRHLVTFKSTTQNVASSASAPHDAKAEPPSAPAPERQVSPPPTTPAAQPTPRDQTQQAPGPAVNAPLPTPAASFTPYQNRRLPSLDSAKNIEDKCEVLLKWMERLDQEYPERASNRFAYQNNAIYLYRDEDFIQVFGRPFDGTTTQWRAEV